MSHAHSTESVTFTCADGTPLHGHFVRAQGDATPGLPVLLCPATGVKQHYYLRFVNWLAHQGHDVLVFDYRGIGLSLHGRLKDCKATLAEWGQQDQVAALEWLLARTGQSQALLLGHSAGGQRLGSLQRCGQQVARQGLARGLVHGGAQSLAPPRPPPAHGLERWPRPR